MVTQNLGAIDRVHPRITHRGRVADVVEPGGGDEVVTIWRQLDRPARDPLDMQPTRFVRLKKSSGEVLSLDG